MREAVRRLLDRDALLGFGALSADCMHGQRTAWQVGFIGNGCAVGCEQKSFNVYATATLSGDVANAIALLKRMARPTSRKHKVTLSIQMNQWIVILKESK